jgi:hypothetical protein
MNKDRLKKQPLAGIYPPRQHAFLRKRTGLLHAMRYSRCPSAVILHKRLLSLHVAASSIISFRARYRAGANFQLYERDNFRTELQYIRPAHIIYRFYSVLSLFLLNPSQGKYDFEQVLDDLLLFALSRMESGSESSTFR